VDIILQTNRVGYLQDIEEVKQQWLNDLLGELGVDMDKFETLSIPARVEMLIDIYKIDVVTYPDLGALAVSLEDDVVGEWGEPVFVLKTDKKAKERYYEITIPTWTIGEEEIDMD
tara:strand:+ start:18 stop:362 length:345 start_codon:yes stop_codon:yes gene_type:complete